MPRQTKKISVRKNKRKIVKGIVHVQASFHNTIVSITDIRGEVLSWSSAGACGFKGSKKSTSFASQTATEQALRELVAQGMKKAEVMISGPGVGREVALRTIRNCGISISFVRDVTSIPHNGCRPPKKRRI